MSESMNERRESHPEAAREVLAPAPPTPAPRLPSGIRQILAAGTILFPGIVLALWVWTPLDFWNSLFLTFLVELLPLLALAQVPLGQDQPIPRIPVYLTSGVTILSLGGISLAAGLRVPGWTGMGLGAFPLSQLLGWTFVLTLSALGILGAFYLVRKALGVRESSLLAEVLPRTRREKGVFVFVSGAAGLGEELAYRGYVVPLLVGLLGSIWVAAALSSIAFGILHAYQGWIGVCRTAILGLVLAASFLLTGSLWPAVLAHTILDLIGGLVLGEALIKE